jgi:hypothetical protein
VRAAGQVGRRVQELALVMAEAVMAELVGDGEALADDGLAPVDEDQREVGLVGAGGPGPEVGHQHRHLAAALDRLEHVLERLLEPEPELFAGRSRAPRPALGVVRHLRSSVPRRPRAVDPAPPAPVTSAATSAAQPAASVTPAPPWP